MKYLFIVLNCMIISRITHAQRLKYDLFQSDVETNVKPWTDRPFFNSPNNFRFAIISDRTNGHRPGVFRDAIKKLNELNPEFVISIGDFIEGYTTNEQELERQWREFDSLLKPLKMPFFLVPGNHDLPNSVQYKLWMQRFGRDYYHFVYKDVLFLVLNSNDGDGTSFSPQQMDYAKQVINRNKGVRWTFLFMHHPIWLDRNASKLNEIEAVLKDRPYSIFAGHTHRYLYTTYKKRDYIVLGTSGGASPLRGAGFGEIDHVSWVTMTDNGPSLVNLELNGILRRDFSNNNTHELADNLISTSNSLPFVMASLEGSKPGGHIVFNLKNSSSLPLTCHLQAYQSQNIQLSKDSFSMTAGSGENVFENVDFSLFPQAKAQQADSIELIRRLAYTSGDQHLPAIQGVWKLSLRPSVPTIINTDLPVFLQCAKVSMTNPYPQTIVRYTTNGQEPTLKSALYKEPISIQNTTMVKARIYSRDNKTASSTQSAIFKKLELNKPVNNLGEVKQGLHYEYYEGKFSRVPDFDTITSLKSGIMKSFDLNLIKGGRQNQFALLIKGFVNIHAEGLYKLYLTSDDGCKMYIDGKLVIDNDGSHSARTKTGFTALKKGLHELRLEYFEDFDEEQIKIEVEDAGKNNRKELSFDDLFCNSAMVN